MDRTFSREEILAAHPIIAECERRSGMVFKTIGGERYAKCPFHADNNPSFRVNEEKGVWTCPVCQVGGSVLDYVARLEGRDSKEVWKDWCREASGEAATSGGNGNGDPRPGENIVATYDYRDLAGDLVYQVVRYHPKTFRQRHMVNGKWVWSMEGVTRVLYRLSEVQRSQEVWVVEGEKDADNLAAVGLVATCNVGGAGKWLDGYTESLKGKHVILCGDTDDPGRAHMEKVLLSIRDVTQSVKVVRVPEPHKDVSDYLKAMDCGSDNGLLVELANKAPVVGGFHLIPVKSMGEMESEYCDFLKTCAESILDLGEWLPSLRGHVRGIVPGEVVTFLADTGTGKTAILQNLAVRCKLVTLLFELELPGTLTFERFMAVLTGMKCSLIEEAYKVGGKGQVNFRPVQHVWCCNKTKLTIPQMKSLIEGAALKIGTPPAVVMVDYVQLVAGGGKNRYERISAAAEDLKALAKETNTIVVAASQVGRPDYADGPMIKLHDAKNAGEIENSSGLVLGCWRDEDDASKLTLKILKNTKGRGGLQVVCNFNGETMQITERSRIDERDIPKQPRTFKSTHPDA